MTLSDLVRQALRMRPDRVVVGECRGAEVLDLLSALNTGHAGGCGTVHANAVEHVPSRLEALGVLGGVGRAAIARQTASALDVVVHLERRDGLRRVVAIGVVVDHGDARRRRAGARRRGRPGRPRRVTDAWPRLRGCWPTWRRRGDRRRRAVAPEVVVALLVGAGVLLAARATPG